MTRLTGVLLALTLAALFVGDADAQSRKSDAAHRRAICGEITKLDLLLYDNPRAHAATTVCSYTDERLLITPKYDLPDERMERFVFLAFVSAGALSNEDFMLPDKVYVGRGSACQVLKTSDAARLQKAAKFGGDSGMMNAMVWATGAPKTTCPK